MKGLAGTFVLPVILLFIFNKEVVYGQSYTTIDNWGFIGGRTGGWSISTDDSNNVTISGDSANSGWVTVRAGFESIEPPVDSILLITGKMKFFGGGFEGLGDLRLGIFYSDSAGTVESGGTDSARWTGTENYHTGYLFIPLNGTNQTPDWALGGTGNMGAVINGIWNSTRGNENYTFRSDDHFYKWMAATEGIYNFSIQIGPQKDGNNKLLLVLQNEQNCYEFIINGEDNNKLLAPKKFNSIAFALSSWSNSTTTGLTISDIKISIIPYPPIPNISVPGFKMDGWGFLRNRSGGWKISVDEKNNVKILGDKPLTDWASIRGNYYGTLGTNGSLTVTGNVKFIGGGFQSPNSFRFGIFNSPNVACLINAGEDSAFWYGPETDYSGYLFVPPSGNSTSIGWKLGGKGTFGVVNNGIWMLTYNWNSYVLNNNRQVPENAEATEGLYEFGISIGLLENGNREIKYKLIKDDSSYQFYGEIIDDHTPPTVNEFNSLNFALSSGNSTTSIAISDVLLEFGASIDIPTGIIDSEESKAPKEFMLKQNYPNPFNPTTNFEFHVAKYGMVTLKIHDVLGNEVANLLDEEKEPGIYTIKFNGSSLSSGVYYYTLKAGSFIDTKKLIILK